MDWLSRPLPDFWGGIGLVSLGVILFVLGTACVAEGYAACGRRNLRWFDPRRAIAPCLSWWLGLTFSGLCIIVSYLGIAVLTDDQDTPLWGMVLCIGTALCALMSFRYWAIEKLSFEVK